MPSTNEALQDAATRHAIYLQRLGGANARAVLELLSEADADLVARLTARIERLGPLDKQQLGRGLATTQRLKRLLQEIRQQNAEVRRAVAAVLDGRLEELAEFETDLAARRIEEAVGVDLGMMRPSPEVLRSATEGAIIRGQTLKQWWGKWGDDRLRQVDGAIRLGAIEGQTTPEIARRLREGLDIQKRSADMLARTATNAVANQARDYLYQANADILQGVRWVSTLDGRTSPICRARDQKIYPIDGGPRPPAHPHCRSTTAPVTKSWDDLAGPNAKLKRGRGADDIDTLFEKRLAAKGFTPEQIARIKRSTRASMNGQVPADLSYSDWLRRQPIEFQDDVLGPTKAKLFRDGELDLDRFVDMNSGREFTLDELRERESAAWARADLDGED